MVEGHQVKGNQGCLICVEGHGHGVFGSKREDCEQNAFDRKEQAKNQLIVSRGAV
jgi:hypothetical protein